MSTISKEETTSWLRRDFFDVGHHAEERKTSMQQGAYATIKTLVPNISEIIGGKSEQNGDENRVIEMIRDYVFKIRIPGVEITHCNFTKTQVEVWYVTENINCDKYEEDLLQEIGSNVEPYKLKLVKKADLPTFKYTSPGQSTILGKQDGCIGAYVTLTDTLSQESNLHALVCGHGKEPGDLTYSKGNPGQRIGEVKVAKEGQTGNTNSYDVGLVCIEDQQRDHHKTSVTMNGQRIQLAAVKDALSQEDIAENQQVMLFNNDNKQGTVRFESYNSQTQRKFDMIGIEQRPGQAIHGMYESGTLVVALSPYQETEVKPVRAVGMLIGIEETSTQPPESMSLAVPIKTNLKELMKDGYCQNKEIQFA